MTNSALLYKGKKFLITALLPFLVLFTIGISTAQELAPTPVTEYRVDDGGNDPFNAFAVDTAGNVTFCGAGDNNATTSVPNSYLVARFANGGSLLFKDYYFTGQGSYFGPSCDMSTDGLGNSYVVLSDSYAYGRLFKYDAAGNRTVISPGGGIPESYNHGIHVTTDALNNVYVYGAGYIEKYDVNGIRLWHSPFNAPFGSIQYIALDGAGNIYATGPINLGSSTVTTAKYAPNGTLLWASNQTAAYLSLRALKLEPDGSVVLAAFKGNGTGTNNISLWKYDTTGNLLWARDPDYGISASLSDMTIDSVGNIIASAALGADILIAKYDSSGNTIWSQIFHTGITEVPRDLAIGNNDSIYVNGNGFVVKYDSAGNHLWTMGAGLDAVAMKVTVDGTMYLGGHGFVTNVDALVVKYLGNQPTLTSINVTPANPTINVGQTQQFTATGTFSDGSTRTLGWQEEAPMPTPRTDHGVGVINGIIYAVGGTPTTPNCCTPLTTLEAYDPVANTWTEKAPMPTARFNLGVAVVNGILYAMGGTNGCPCSLATVEAYDPTTDTWTTKASMPTAHSVFGTAVVNGILYVVGGTSNNSGDFLQTVEAYNPVTDTWTTKSPMPTGRDGIGIGVINGIIYAVGGTNSSYFGTLATNEAYDPVADSWTEKSPMLIPTIVGGSGVLNNLLYAVGGQGPNANTIPSNSDLATVEVYDPSSDSWSMVAPIPTPRSYTAMGVVNQTLFAVGGHNAISSSANSNVEGYTPPDIIWSNSNTTVATIDGDGLSTGLSPGISTITATAGNISGNTTLTVVSPTYTLTLNSGGTGSGTVTGAGTYNYNTQVTLTAAAGTGSTFAGWSGTGCTTGVVTVTGNITCTATFTLNSYVVSLTTAGNGTGTVTGAGTYNYNTQVTLSATASTGSTFAGWSGTGCTTGVVTITANITCTATFTLNTYTLTLTTAGLGSGTVSGAGTYNYNQTATVSATANTGSTFSGWTGPDAAACTTGSVTMTGNKACMATFTLNQVITFGALGNKTYGDAPFTVSATGGASGNPVTFTASPAGVCTSSGTNGSSISIIGVGVCIVTAHQAGTSNYNAAADVPQSFTVSKAILTVTADNKTKLLNASLPSLTATITGFKNGETLGTSGVIGSPNLTTLATATSPVGSYPITSGLGSLASNNYSFTFVNGTLVIQYVTSGLCDGDVGHTILQPINSDGTSVFKQKSTVPAKFRVCDANGVSIGTPGVVATFLLTQIVSGTVVQTVDEAVDSTTPDASFRWDSTGQQWIFNMSTKSLSANMTYYYQITLNDGSSINFLFGLK
jgi:hypothetical protein